MAALILLVTFGATLRAGAAPYADFVIDARTGQVLHQENADTRLHPASLTKMMTLYIAFEAITRGEIGLDSQVLISKKAASEEPSKLGLVAGQKIELRYLIRAAAVKSANDAATAIGEAIEGSEAAFARRMNRTAQALGMTRTTFKNAHGLTEEGHLSTARDMTTLGRHVFYDYPQYYNLFSRITADAKVRTVAHTNRRFLRDYAGADGIKTGYTRAAGFNLVASAERDGKRIITTVFGGRSTATRNDRVAELMNLGFNQAPGAVQLARPSAPDYESLPGTPGSTAGKTLRVSGLVNRSPRPTGRPRPQVPEGMIVALQDGVAEAVALATDDQAEQIASLVAGAEKLEDTSAEAPLPGGVSLAGIRPEPTPVEVREEMEDAIAVADTASTEEVAGMIAGAGAATPQDGADIALAASGKPAPGAEAPDIGANVEDLVVAAMGGGAASDANDTDMAPAAATVVPKSRPRVLDFAVAEAAEPQQASIPAPAPRPEVVVRASTSGGRHWGISVGQYNSRFEAEKVLLKTALREVETLDGSLRKVNQRATGYDATFMGLTQDQAAAACARLQARGSDCSTVSPG
ncbi:serine hydrolase [Roseicyclus sp. F158]|uniref:Serine hydrolase n=1 Tax=Tropicimonas omnivorans TaxID=3075590 RepID=A0ABU3DBX7_9RHOB|nr:serine hydrolase [Roseicyclus sp. F158]MDT0681165.1 serine hydrolase [Roseicyclus sp. F158]